MSLSRPGRVQRSWNCWYGDRGEFEAVLAAFDRHAVAHDRGGAGDSTDSAHAVARELGARDSRGGDWRKVLDHVDAEQLVEFTISRPESMTASGDLWLEFSTTQGVRLKADLGQPDAERVRAALSPVIEQGVPRWSWWRSHPAELMLAVLVGVLIEVAWLLLVGLPRDLEVVALTAPLAVGIIITFGVLYLLRPRFPKFRVRDRK